MINATIIGNLAADAEQKQAGGSDLIEFRLASTEKGKDGEVTTWVRCAWFGKRATAVAKYLEKGKQVAVSGTLQTREWTAKDGQKRSSLECRVNELQLLGGGGGQRRERRPQSEHETSKSNGYADDDYGDDGSGVPF